MSSIDRDGELLSNRTRAGRWGVEFPYGWDADELVSRRHLLQWAVMASGALFAATAALAGLAIARDHTRGTRQRIVESGALAPGAVHYFEYPEEGDHAILLNLEDAGFVAYSGKCTHLSCAVYWDGERGELICPCHNGIFDPRTGEVVAGPPSRPLPRIVLSEEGGTLYALEEVPG